MRRSRGGCLNWEWWDGMGWDGMGWDGQAVGEWRGRVKGSLEGQVGEGERKTLSAQQWLASNWQGAHPLLPACRLLPFVLDNMFLQFMPLVPHVPLVPLVPFAPFAPRVGRNVRVRLRRRGRHGVAESAEGGFTHGASHRSTQAGGGGNFQEASRMGSAPTGDPNPPLSARSPF